MAPWTVSLIKWFDHNKRPMPWRDNPEPYYVWVSEMMLQQTQVATALPYFNRFIDLFPTVYKLAESSQEQVLKAWEGLGYYSRARNLHKAAQLVCEKHSGKLPSNYKELQSIPGIGPYCAAAIASIAFGEAIPSVDGNFLRVLCRFWGIEDDISKASTRNQIFDRCLPFIQKSNPSSFNQGIMELGATLCSPKNPACPTCPLSSECNALKTNKTELLPVKTKKQKVPTIPIAVGIIKKENKVLIAKRKQNGMLAGLWEFPGGKQENAESLQQTVIREVLEEAGVVVTVDKKLIMVKHTFSHFKIELTAFLTTLKSGQAKALSSDEVKWVTLSDLDSYPFPTANKKIINALRKHMKENEV
jgi:A/G-specific adenine glycosylase